ncbi:hypothetical protein [Micromonospora sp. IBHARD004]|uniref:hypothetical protein n=1 Tax=Micromonospora sp. IBHARD004 TaxID=3457764 RepID=UPI004057F4ED
MSDISPRTAELALLALGAVLRRAGLRRNGVDLPAEMRQAFAELDAAAYAERADDSATRTTVDPRRLPAPRSELIDTATAARRLGLTIRATQKRCATGRLPATRVGRRSWLITWEEQGWPTTHRST